MEDRTALWILLAMLGIGAVVGIAGLVLAQRPKPPSGGTGKTGEVNIRVKSNRATGYYKEAGYSDINMIDFDIVRGETVLYSGHIDRIVGNEWRSVVVTLPAGSCTLKIYYPFKSNPAVVVTKDFTVIANSGVTVDIVLNISEPQGYVAFSVDTPLSKIEADRLDWDSKGHDGVVNGDIVSWMVPVGKNIEKGYINEIADANPVYYLFTNVKAVKELDIVVHEQKHTDSETQTTFEVMVFKDSIAFRDCRVVVYKGENPIIEKDVYDIGDGEYGIREIVTRGTGGYDIMVKDKLGNTYGSIHIDSLEACKVHVFVFDVVNKWR